MLARLFCRLFGHRGETEHQFVRYAEHFPSWIGHDVTFCRRCHTRLSVGAEQEHERPWYFFWNPGT